jgi:WXG100 family type VII secretion target
MTTPLTTAGGVTFHATAAQIAQVAQQASNTSSEVQTQLSQLQAYVYDLGAQWLGAASSTFQALMADFQTYANLLNQGLAGIAEGLNGNWQNYSQSEQDNINSLRLVNGSLPGGTPGATIG